MFTYSTFTFSPGDLMARRLNAWCAYDPRMQRQPPPIRPAGDGSQVLIIFQTFLKTTSGRWDRKRAEGCAPHVFSVAEGPKILPLFESSSHRVS